MGATDRINDLVNITSRLVDLLVEENKALADNRNQDASEMLKEKSALSRSYDAHVESLKDMSEELGTVDKDLRERLRALGEKLKLLVDKNARHLKVAMEVNHHVMDAIADAARSQKPGPGIYSAKGSTDNDSDAAYKSIAVSVDRSL